MFEVWGWQLSILILAALSFLAELFAGLRLPKTESRTESKPLQLNMWTYLRQPAILASMVVSILLFFIFILFMTFWLCGMECWSIS
jgi:predicted MFS family arabinose efflux permease